MRAILVVFVLADLMEPRVFTVRIMPVSALRWGIERIKNTGAVRREMRCPIHMIFIIPCLISCVPGAEERYSVSALIRMKINGAKPRLNV